MDRDFFQKKLFNTDTLNQVVFHFLREQTFREVEILRLVQGHDFIIDLVDVFESSTYIFLVFEMCANGELFDFLTSQVAVGEIRYIK